MQSNINYVYTRDFESSSPCQIARRDLHTPVLVSQPIQPQRPIPVAYNFVYVRNQWPIVIRAVTDLLTALVWSSNIKHANQPRRSPRDQQATKAPTIADSLVTIASFCGVLAICGLTCGLIGDQQNYWSTRLRELFPSSLSGWKNASTGFYLATLLLPFVAIPTLVLTFTPVSAVIGVIGTALLWTASAALSALLGFRITNEWLQSGVDKALLKKLLESTVGGNIAISSMSYYNTPPQRQGPFGGESSSFSSGSSSGSSCFYTTATAYIPAADARVPAASAPPLPPEGTSGPSGKRR